MRRAGYLGVFLCLAAMPGAAAAAPSADGRPWLGEELPLPMAVRTPQDLAVKAVAERQYLIFNLLAGGKLAWDAGDFASAATKWEALLRIHPLDPELEKTIKPLANEARSRAAAGRSTADTAAPPASSLSAADSLSGGRGAQPCRRHPHRQREQNGLWRRAPGARRRGHLAEEGQR
ncbi:MAG TPA: hypothetical protein VLT58_00830 [Polyangia bacterium]|nr:hypothetical protein [Polyangia bacterium]